MSILGMFGKRVFMAAAALCVLLWTTCPSGAASLEIVNNTNSAIYAIYISASGSGYWEDNAITGRQLPEGRGVRVRIKDGYEKFDLRVEDKKGYDDYRQIPGHVRRIVLKGGGKAEYL